jgi:beta-N-acetylhexosaminidase
VTESSRFVVGLEGPSLTALERAAYSRNLPFGFLLLSRNLSSAVQAAELTAELRSLGKPEPLLFVDQEGGTVDRLGPLLGQPFASAAAAVAAFNELLARPREIRVI